MTVSTASHRRRLRLLPVLLISLVLAGAPAARAGATSVRPWAWPLHPRPAVVRGFDPPQSPYGPGHRGVDLLGTTGQPVLAVAGGTVRFAGSVAGRGVVVIDHGGLDSTYQPVTPLVSVGERVRRRETIGALQSLHSHCAPRSCLHLGARRGDAYVDPLTLLPVLPIRLTPWAGLLKPGGDEEKTSLLPPRAPPLFRHAGEPAGRPPAVALL